MKKFAIISLSLFALNTFSWEVQIKGGYDFFRGRSAEINKQLTSKHNLSETGFTLGVEFIPFNKSIVELGLGIEYNFGTKNALYSKYLKENGKQGYTIPLYSLIKANILRNDTNTQALYAFGRLGYAFSADEVKKEFPAQSGFYFGTGLGFEIKYFVFEGLYDAVYHYSQVNNNGSSSGNSNGASNSKTHNIDHKVGIRAGVRFGDFAKKKPVIVKPIVPIISMPKVEVIAEEKASPKVYKTQGKLIKAFCNEETKVCIINGFAVSKREPNAQEKQNIAEIAELINEFAGEGYADITGHTDSDGKDVYNDKLSLDRAKMVVKLLKEAGLRDGIKIRSISGKGEKEPIASNKTKEGKYLNRRVEIKFSDLILEKEVIEK